GGSLRLDWTASATTALTLDATVERRRADIWIAHPKPNFHYERIEVRPHEDRLRGRGVLRTGAGRMGELLLHLGVERVTAEGFEPGRDRTGWLFGAVLRHRAGGG